MSRESTRIGFDESACVAARPHIASRIDAQPELFTSPGIYAWVKSDIANVVGNRSSASTKFLEIVLPTNGSQQQTVGGSKSPGVNAWARENGRTSSEAARPNSQAAPARIVVALLIAVSISVVSSGCSSHEPPKTQAEEPLQTLSEYGLFVGNGATQEPVEGVVPYNLNSALFSDYAVKYRFVRLPPGTSATYNASEAFDFPVGTVIAKTFAYPHDARDTAAAQKPDGRRLIETRILKRTDKGWIGLPYIWNEEQTEATLDVAGGTVDVAWIHTDGKNRTDNYIIPNTNQCKGCHEGTNGMEPIGPKARHLNRDFSYAEGMENQLAHWTRLGLLKGAPAPDQAPRTPVWDDPNSGTLDARARAWLEINCAHCHSPTGPARNSGLDLLASQSDPTKYGVFKSPVAAGRGSGGLEYDIVPGKPDESILAFRIGSTHPGIMMPELGKRLVDEEGVALIREWIAAMPDRRKKSHAVGAGR